MGLFLALCDIACNPAEGFPQAIRSFGTFLTDTDPGLRFAFASRLIDMRKSSLKSLVRNYSREEYTHICEELCGAMLCPTPLSAAESVLQWSTSQETVADLMAEEAVFVFSPGSREDRIKYSLYIHKLLYFQCIYDLTKQWMVRRGPFVYDFGWLSQQHVEDELESWASGHFHRTFGVSPAEFIIL